MKNIISLFLVLATLLSCFMLTVSADETVVSDEGRLPFEDVKDSHWFYDSVALCYANSVIKGMNENTFDFSGQLTRAQFVTMLAGLEGVDTSTYTVEQFTDIKDTYWYYGAVAWAYGEGIISGMTENTFEGNGKLTRAQLAVIMNNYMQNKYDVATDEGTLDKFTDKPKAEYWYYDAMIYAVSAGLISGMSDGTLCATGIVTRAQAAVIFESFMEKYFYGICEHSFTEPDCVTAAVCEKCGFVNGIPKGHMLREYDCVTGGKCTVCHEDVEPSKTLHNYTPATCTEPMTCTRCNAVSGKANGHKWIQATCYEPRKCKVCHIEEGRPLGHSTDIGRCSRCGYEYYPTSFDKAAYNMCRQANTTGVDGIYYRDSYKSETRFVVYYYKYSKAFKIESQRKLDNGDTELITITVKQGDSHCDYTYEYVSDYTLKFRGGKSLNMSKFTKDFEVTLTNYTSGNKYEYYDSFKELFTQTLDETSAILNKLYGGSIKDIGFINY